MSDTPRTDAVNKYLRTRDDYTKTDHEVWMDHSCDIESELNTAHESLLYARGVHIQKQIALDKANDRIKRLEEAGDAASHEAGHEREHDALEIWNKANEDKL